MLIKMSTNKPTQKSCSARFLTLLSNQPQLAAKAWFDRKFKNHAHIYLAQGVILLGVVGVKST